MQLSDWLNSLGLGRYAAVLAEQEIDWEVLGDLTAEDLAEMGLPLGPRKKLLKAIAGLPSADPPHGKDPSDTSVEEREHARSEAERRQLTVMFIDLVGSTRLSEQLDPEDMGELIRRYQQAVASEVERYDGHVAKYMGDGVLAYFGWPTAHEDESERAIRAGLAVTEQVGQLETPSGGTLCARVGVATGQVVVGEIFGAIDGEAVVGDTPNLAARLQQLAEPNTVVISQATQRLVGRLFELTDLGSQRLNGFSRPVRAYQVLKESDVESRFEAMRGGRLLPLVGREHELSMLLDRFERARSGEGQVVVLMGEAGIGKSRLLLALRERLAETNYMAISHFCSPYHANSAFYPIIGLLERAAGFQAGETGAARLEKLAKLLSLGSTRLDRAVPLVAAILGVPLDETYAPLDIAPQRQKELSLEVLVDQVAGLARERPVLAVYEDLQWVDPTTLETISMLIDRVPSLPVLVLVTCRPEMSVPWQGHAHVMQLTVTRLPRKDGEAIVSRVTGGKALPQELLDAILARSDGVPLFVEELTKTVLEGGDLRETADAFELAGPLPPFAVPSTLHDSLMARLDRLAPVRDLAQTAAVIGREFSHDALEEVSGLSQESLQQAVGQLLEAELIWRRGVPPNVTYSFRHALVQDAAYQSLLKSRRHAIHNRVAEMLQRKSGRDDRVEPELIAHHLTEAGRAADAIQYWEMAGQHAMSRSATAEAIAHFSKAIELTGSLEQNPDRQRLELGLQLALASAFVAARGIASPPVGAAYARARDLCDQLEDTRQWFAIRYGQCIYHLYRAELDAARQCAVDLAAATDPQDDDLRFFALRAAGVAALPRGDFGQAQTSLTDALALYDPERHRAPAFVYAFDPQVVCLDYLSRTHLAIGALDEAVRCHEQALAAARKRQHHNTLALPLFFGAMIFQLLGNRRMVRERATELQQVAVDQGLRLWTAGAAVLTGWLSAENGGETSALREMEEGMAAWQSTGAECFMPYFLALAAEVHAKAGDLPLAIDQVDSAIGRAEATGERWLMAEHLRLKGELLRQSHAPTGEVVACFTRAVDEAREQGACFWELRAARPLAETLLQQQRVAEATRLLAGLDESRSDWSRLEDVKALRALRARLRQARSDGVEHP